MPAVVALGKASALLASSIFMRLCPRYTNKPTSQPVCEAHTRQACIAAQAHRVRRQVSSQVPVGTAQQTGGSPFIYRAPSRGPVCLLVWLGSARGPPAPGAAGRRATHPSACPPARLPTCPPARLPTCPLAYLPACLPARLRPTYHTCLCRYSASSPHAPCPARRRHLQPAAVWLIDFDSPIEGPSIRDPSI